MTLEQALDFLDSILSKVAGSRQDHINIQNALDVVGRELKPKEDPEA